MVMYIIMLCLCHRVIAVCREDFNGVNIITVSTIPYFNNTFRLVTIEAASSTQLKRDNANMVR